MGSGWVISGQSEFFSDFWIFSNLTRSLSNVIKYLSQWAVISQIILVKLLSVVSLSASLLLNIFLSFEVGIAHAIANFKWKENTYSLKN